MNIILVLAHNQRQFERYCGNLRWTRQSGIELVCPLSEDALVGYVPLAIIKLPEWWLDKSEIFLHKIDIMESEMSKEPHSI